MRYYMVIEELYLIVPLKETDETVTMERLEKFEDFYYSDKSNGKELAHKLWDASLISEEEFREVNKWLIDLGKEYNVHITYSYIDKDYDVETRMIVDGENHIRIDGR